MEQIAHGPTPSNENDESQIMWLQPKISQKKILDPCSLSTSIDSLTKELLIHYKILPSSITVFF